MAGDSITRSWSSDRVGRVRIRVMGPKDRPQDPEGRTRNGSNPGSQPLLPADLHGADGRLLARKGEAWSQALLDRVSAQRIATGGLSSPLKRTRLFEHLSRYLERPMYAPLFGRARRRYELFWLVREQQISQSVLAEMDLLRVRYGWAYEHTLVSSAVATLLLKHYVPEEEPLAQTMVACMLRDVGLSRVSPAIVGSERKLRPDEFREYLAHESYSALLLARAGASSLAVRLAARHHRVSAASRWLPPTGAMSETELDQLFKVLKVAEAFTGMIAPRAFRGSTFSLRGALDTLIDGANAGHFDLDVVKLLTAYCRQQFNLIEFQFSGVRRGFVPKTNNYGLERPRS